MKTYRAEISIDASPERIWDILVNTAAYPDWDPGMVRIEGKIAPGETVKFFTNFSPDQAFAVKVTDIEPGKRMVFTGGIPLGLFKSERIHTLTPAAGGNTTFLTEETFSGLLLPIFGRSLPDLNESFRAFAAGLKKQAEKRKM